MAAQMVLLIRDDAVGWPTVEGIFRSMPEAGRMRTVSTVDEAKYLSEHAPPDVVVTALEIQGESTIPMISYFRDTLEIRA